ncbi:MAG: hypothetical protein U5K31_06375 [Balneolaceae bacterium]|nr:hypothetical protein [Balneolaceae bacterium]
MIAAGCSSTQSYFLDPEYASEKTKASVGILLIEKKFFPDVYSHTFGSLRTTEVQTFRQFLESHFSTAAETETWLVPGEAVAGRGDFRSRLFRVDADSFHVMVPENRQALAFPNRTPRFLLILDQFHYRRTLESSSESNYAGHEGSELQLLVFETRYLYWDVVQERVIGYGTARGQKNLVSEDPAVSEYSEVLSEAVTQIARWGPIITP